MAHVHPATPSRQGFRPMEPDRFDDVVRALFSAPSRRDFIRALVGLAVGILLVPLVAMVTPRPTRRGKRPIGTRRRGRTSGRRKIPIAAQKTPHSAKTPMNQRRGSYRDVATRGPTARATLTRSVRTAAAVRTTSRHAAAVPFMASAVPVITSAPNPLISRTWRAAALTTRFALAGAATQEKNAARRRTKPRTAARARGPDLQEVRR